MHKTVTIALTGGGTAGHVMPHLALLDDFRARGWSVFYIGSDAIEKKIITDAGIPFHTIAAGKLRRYFSLQNLVDLFKIFFGFLQSLVILIRHRPDLVFSKGGFVSVPVAVAAWCLRIPVLSHESDLTPGLATRIISRFAKKILYSFPESASHLPNSAQWVGTPVRRDLLTGDRQRGLNFCEFNGSENLPTVLVMGGSTGAQRVNKVLEAALPNLVEFYRVIHLTGKGKGIDFKHSNYRAYEFIGKELKDIFAAADYVISRAGANSIFELLALEKPMLLIPLQIGSRGDQLDNARCFQKHGWAMVLPEPELSPEILILSIGSLVRDTARIRAKQHDSGQQDAQSHVLNEISSTLKS